MRWDAAISGYLDILMWGKDPERVINMALIRGIHIWDIQHQENGRYLFKVRLGGYKALRHLVKRCDCRIKIAGKKGIPFFLLRAGKRRVLIAGMLFFFIVLYFLSSFVWFVEVKGNKKIETEHIIKTLDEHGVKVGAPISSFDKEQAKAYLLAEIPQLAWANIQIRGSGVIIEVAEKTLIPSELENKPADIIAARDGRIEELLVLQGTALVSEGSLVYKGQSLVAGLSYPLLQLNKDGSIVPAGNPEKVRAKALVRARVAHEQLAECPILEEVDQDTGEKTDIVVCRYKSWEMVIKGPKNIPYQHYRTISRSRTLLAGRIPAGLVEIITVTYIEQKHEIYKRGLEGAYTEAVIRAKKEIIKTLPPDYRILSEKHEPILQSRTDLVRVRYILETIEDIGTYK